MEGFSGVLNSLSFVAFEVSKSFTAPAINKDEISIKQRQIGPGKGVGPVRTNIIVCNILSYLTNLSPSRPLKLAN